MSLVFGALALTFAVFSLFCKNKVKMLFCQIPANIFYCLSFIFAGIFTAFAGVLVATVRTVVFFIYDYKRLRPNIWLLLFFEVLTVACVAIFLSCTLDILPLIALVIFTYGMWQKSEDVFRICAIISASLFAIFNVVFGLYLGVVQEGLLIAAGVVSLSKSLRAGNIKNHKLLGNKF